MHECYQNTEIPPRKLGLSCANRKKPPVDSENLQDPSVRSVQPEPEMRTFEIILAPNYRNVPACSSRPPRPAPPVGIEIPVHILQDKLQ